MSLKTVNLVQNNLTRRAIASFLIIFQISCFLFAIDIMAEFKSRVPCKDDTKVCTEGKATRNVDGMQISRDCWKSSYIKSCEVISKDDCKNLARSSGCYYRDPGKVDYRDPEVVKGRDMEVTEHCKVLDYYGNCLNIFKQFVCKGTIFETEKYKEVVFNPSKKNAAKRLSCLAAGVVIENKNNGADMASTLSKLQTAHQMSDGVSGNEAGLKNKRVVENIFPGKQFECEIKVLNAMDCCAIDGWLQQLFDLRCGETCKQLVELRKNGQCVLAGEENETAIISFGKLKKSFICYESKLARLIQEGARSQLHRSYSIGSSGRYDASGLSIGDIERVDFDRINLSEFYTEVNAMFKGKLEKNKHQYEHKNLKSSFTSEASDIKSSSTPKQGGFNKGKYDREGDYIDKNSGRDISKKVRN
jgi:conjugal transfer mating pair stabilization protein TraN